MQKITYIQFRRAAKEETPRTTTEKEVTNFLRTQVTHYPSEAYEKYITRAWYQWKMRHQPDAVMIREAINDNRIIGNTPTIWEDFIMKCRELAYTHAQGLPLSAQVRAVMENW